MVAGWTRISHGQLTEKLNGCIDALISWSNNLRYRFKEDIDCCKRRLQELRDIATIDAYKEMESLNAKFCQSLIHEDMFWQQRAKKFWLQDGDTNSRFFHASATMRQKRNHIRCLLNEDNVEVTNAAGMQSIGQSYFFDLFFCRDIS